MLKNEMNKKGFLEVICGSMFSGKSEELIRRLKRTHIARQTTIVFKHSFDNRVSSEHVVSHNGSKLYALSIKNAIDIVSQVQDHIMVVGIDEAQFFGYDLIDIVLNLVQSGKRVIIAGLNLDFKAVPFGPIPALMALADTVTKLSAICIICGSDAYFSQRLVNNEPAKYDDPLVLIGAQESYQARCRNCYVIDRKPVVWQSNL